VSRAPREHASEGEINGELNRGRVLGEKFPGFPEISSLGQSPKGPRPKPEIPDTTVIYLNKLVLLQQSPVIETREQHHHNEKYCRTDGEGGGKENNPRTFECELMQ